MVQIVQKDAPGHYWWQDTPSHLYGLHYNIGPSEKKIGGHLMQKVMNYCIWLTL